MSNHQQKGWYSQNLFRETQKTRFQKHQRVFGKIKEVYWRGKGLIGQTAWDALVVCKCCILTGFQRKVLPPITGRANPSETCSTMHCSHSQHLMTCSRSTAVFVWTAASKYYCNKSGHYKRAMLLTSVEEQQHSGFNWAVLRDGCFRKSQHMQWLKIMAAIIVCMALAHSQPFSLIIVLKWIVACKVCPCFSCAWTRWSNKANSNWYCFPTDLLLNALFYKALFTDA